MTRAVVFSLWVLSQVFLTAQVPQPKYRINASFVRVPVTVCDSDGRLVQGLERADFRVFDEGEAREIDNLVLEQTPLHVVVLLDVSGSVRGETESIKEAAASFALHILDANGRVALMTFSDKLMLLQDWTKDDTRLRRSLKRIQPGFRTALFDSLLSICQKHMAKLGGRKVVVALTDGGDNQSRTAWQTVLKEYLLSDVSLHLVSRTRFVLPKVQRQVRVVMLNRAANNFTNDSRDFWELYFREKETALEHVAESTGGRVLHAETPSDLKRSLQQLALELKSRYVLTFRPPDDSSKRFRLIRVTCSRPSVTDFHRSQYAWSGRTAEVGISR